MTDKWISMLSMILPSWKENFVSKVIITIAKFNYYEWSQHIIHHLPRLISGTITQLIIMSRSIYLNSLGRTWEPGQVHYSEVACEVNVLNLNSNCNTENVFTWYLALITRIHVIYFKFYSFFKCTQEQLGKLSVQVLLTVLSLVLSNIYFHGNWMKGHLFWGKYISCCILLHFSTLTHRRLLKAAINKVDSVPNSYN